jgi:hypothetical protein
MKLTSILEKDSFHIDELANIWLYMLEGGNELEVKYDAKL